MNSLVTITKCREAVIDSLKITKYFKKNHRHVLTTTRDIIEVETVNEPDFRLIKYKDSRGRENHVFTMNKDGFALLAIGFTGKEYHQWKIKYIQAFNDMEAKFQQSQKILKEACANIRDTFSPLNEGSGKISEHSGNHKLFPRRGSWCSRGKFVVALNVNQPYLLIFEAVMKDTTGSLEISII